MLIVVRDLLILVLCGALTEMGAHRFVTDRSFWGATFGACGLVATVLSLFALVPELKDVMRIDSIDFTKTFAVAIVFGVGAVASGGLIGFSISNWFFCRTEPA